MDEANQCLGCKKPRCQQGCPIQTNIPEVIRLLKANKLDEAGRKAGIVRCCLRLAGMVWREGLKIQRKAWGRGTAAAQPHFGAQRFPGPHKTKAARKDVDPSGQYAS